MSYFYYVLEYALEKIAITDHYYYLLFVLQKCLGVLGCIDAFK